MMLLLFGVNYRMSELIGAVALAKLRKIDNIVSKMRKNKKIIRERIQNIHGLSFREITDKKGDVSVCLIFYLPDPAL